MIIADILMPEMDGFQLCKTVKSDDIFGRVPFVFYTASYMEDRDEELAYKVGADKYIRKPVDPDVFIKIIQGIIDDSRDQRLTPRKPAAEHEEAILKLYNERLVAKLQQKMITLAQEIEERKKSESNLRKSEERHKKLFDEIQERVKDLEGFYQMAIGRELRMKELKEEIAELKEKLTECTGGKSEDEDE